MHQSCLLFLCGTSCLADSYTSVNHDGHTFYDQEVFMSLLSGHLLLGLSLVLFLETWHPWGRLFLCSGGFGENVWQFIPSLALLLFFFKVEIGSYTLIEFHSLCQDQSTVAQHAETSMAECSLTSCVLAHFWLDSHFRLCPDSGIVSPL